MTNSKPAWLTASEIAARAVDGYASIWFSDSDDSVAELARLLTGHTVRLNELCSLCLTNVVNELCEQEACGP